MKEGMGPANMFSTKTAAIHSIQRGSRRIRVRFGKTSKSEAGFCSSEPSLAGCGWTCNSGRPLPQDVKTAFSHQSRT
jgi:hypothetical protein